MIQMHSYNYPVQFYQIVNCNMWHNFYIATKTFSNKSKDQSYIYDSLGLHPTFKNLEFY